MLPSEQRAFASVELDVILEPQRPAGLPAVMETETATGGAAMHRHVRPSLWRSTALPCVAALSSPSWRRGRAAPRAPLLINCPYIDAWRHSPAVCRSCRVGRIAILVLEAETGVAARHHLCSSGPASTHGAARPPCVDRHQSALLALINGAAKRRASYCLCHGDRNSDGRCRAAPSPFLASTPNAVVIDPAYHLIFVSWRQRRQQATR